LENVIIRAASRICRKPSLPIESSISPRVFESAAAAGEFAAREALVRLERARAARGLMTLGCPGGRSLRSTYRALARLAGEGHIDVSALHIVMMDEYVEAHGERWALCPADAHYSCRRFGDVEIRQLINAGVAARRIPAANVHVPDPNAPLDYETLIERLGGIDVFLLASGASDGHVAFNPQGCALHERTRTIELSEPTRRDNLATFPQFRGLHEVPRFGVTVGPATIATHSHAAMLVLLGAAKTTAFERVSAATQYDPDWPASVVLACADAQIVADEAAAGVKRERMRD
jgi:glucosamine-6-phosphate deaminase